MQKLAPVLCLLALAPFSPPGRAQHISGFDKSRAEGMLNEIQKDIRKHYYDPQLHGLDWDAEVRAAKQKIDDSPSLNMAMSHVAALMDKLNDSHTFFLLPPRPYLLDFGYSEEMIGDRCFITRVRPGSDADKKGLHPGDEVLAINGYRPLRTNLWKMDYVYRGLRPQPNLTLDLKTPQGSEKKLVIEALEVQYPRIETIWDYYFGMPQGFDIDPAKPLADIGSGVAVYRYGGFEETEEQVEKILKQLKPYKTAILDLRGNGGGNVETLKWLLGGFFENSITIADRVARDPKDRTPMITKPKAKTYVAAKLIVLIDSRSASAAEIFAKTIQSQKRGTVVGDVSSGSVMESRHFQYQSGIDIVAFYGASITEADVIMPDGKSLERVGVTPDVLILPTGADLAAHRDPVVARAAELAGVTLSPEMAGKLYPEVWKKH